MRKSVYYVPFSQLALKGVKEIYQLSSQVIPIDGKTLRRSYDKAKEKPALQMVSAFAMLVWF